ncbi:hypothetical protein OH492_23760 [Vibrio chagasii]|nr:hypothetical protein [Vibrio chagasii]
MMSSRPRSFLKRNLGSSPDYLTFRLINADSEELMELAGQDVGEFVEQVLLGHRARLAIQLRLGWITKKLIALARRQAPASLR